MKFRSITKDVELVTGKLFAKERLGIGNSAAASTPGSVVRRMEVFDEAGNSLVYVPIYDSIM